MKPEPKPEIVHLYPTEPVGEFTVPNVPAVEMDVTPQEAKRLLAFQPPAFTLEPPQAKEAD